MDDEDSITSVNTEIRTFPPPHLFSKKAHIKSEEEYKQIYKQSITHPEQFWARQAENIEWFKRWDKVFLWDKENARFSWFIGGKLNISYNCLDRHLKERGNKTAIIWQGEQEKEVVKLSYKEL